MTVTTGVKTAPFRDMLVLMAPLRRASQRRDSTAAHPN